MLSTAVKSAGVPHVIVIGNEKGGSGKSTIAMHMAVALMKTGQRLATIDLDDRQRTLTHYIENRRAWGHRCGFRLELPTHFVINRGANNQLENNEAAEVDDFERAIAATEHRHDFVLIDTPPQDSYLMRLAHSIADTLVTPLNESFIDIDVLAKLDPVNFAVTGVSHYAELVREMRRHRRSIDGALSDWIVVCNRLSRPDSAISPVFSNSLQDLALALGFRIATGFHERQVYRDLFPRGLSVMDDLGEVVPGRDTDPSHSIARSEVEDLLHILKLPIDERGRRRAAARREWFSKQDDALATGDIFADLPP
jgi:chromosome partitioning protein